MKLPVMIMFAIAAAIAAPPALAQTQTHFPVDTAQFAKRASDVTSVSLDKTMLQFASQFLSSSDEDRHARDIISHLDGIYIRDFEFKNPSSYTDAEVEAIRRQFHAPEWNRIVSTRSKGTDGNTDIYVRTKAGQVQGMFIISAEPEELGFVQILGPIQASDLAELSGHFGVPVVVHDGNSGGKGGKKP